MDKAEVLPHPPQLPSRASQSGRPQHPRRLPHGQRPTRSCPPCNTYMRGHAGPRHHLQTERPSPAAPCYLPARLCPGGFHARPTTRCPLTPLLVPVTLPMRSPRQGDRGPAAGTALPRPPVQSTRSFAFLKQADWLGPLPWLCLRVGCAPRSCRLPFPSQLTPRHSSERPLPTDLTASRPSWPTSDHLSPTAPLLLAMINAETSLCTYVYISCLFPSTPMKLRPGPWLSRWL